MLVITPFENIDHCVSGDSVQPSKGSHCRVGIRKLFSPGAYLGIGEKCRRMIFAMLAVAWRQGTALSVGVEKIVGVGSKKEMRGVDAGRIIPAWAIVADQHAVWNWPIVQFVRDAWRFSHTWLCARSCLQLTVPVTVLASSPQPAIVNVAPIHLLPESLYEGTHGPDLVVMSDDKANGMTFGMSQLGIASLGNWSRLTASTFTEFLGGFLCVHRCNYTPIRGVRLWQMLGNLLPFSVTTGG